MEWEGPPVLPSLDLPGALKLPAPIFDVPKGELPSYKPMVVPLVYLDLLQVFKELIWRKNLQKMRKKQKLKQNL